MSLNNNPLPNMDDENINNPIYHNVPPQHPSQMMNQPPQSQPAMHAARQQQVYINGGNGKCFCTVPRFSKFCCVDKIATILTI